MRQDADEGSGGGRAPGEGEAAFRRERPAHVGLPEEPALGAAQRELFLSCAAWRERMVKRLVRRFGKWARPDDIVGTAKIVTMQCTTTWDPTRGVPFEAYALKAMVYAVGKLAERARKLAREAYRAVASCGELYLADPKIVLGTEEERTEAIHELARQCASAAGLVLCGTFSADLAHGGEDALIDRLDQQRAVAALRGLDERRRRVLELRYGADEDAQSAESIAATLGVAIVTVRREHGRALAELRAEMA